jgi:hypothetical protein
MGPVIEPTRVQTGGSSTAQSIEAKAAALEQEMSMPPPPRMSAADLVAPTRTSQPMINLSTETAPGFISVERPFVEGGFTTERSQLRPRRGESLLLGGALVVLVVLGVIVYGLIGRVRTEEVPLSTHGAVPAGAPLVTAEARAKPAEAPHAAEPPQPTDASEVQTPAGGRSKQKHRPSESHRAAATAQSTSEPDPPAPPAPAEAAPKKPRVTGELHGLMQRIKREEESQKYPLLMKARDKAEALVDRLPAGAKKSRAVADLSAMDRTTSLDAMVDAMNQVIQDIDAASNESP